MAGGAQEPDVNNTGRVGATPAADSSLKESALLLLGHGSTLNADSSAPTWQHAEEIRRRGLFGEVHVGFWKEEPNFRQTLAQTGLPRVYVVPNFISSGYFTEQVIPRELGLDGEVTRRSAQEIIYCQPVGLHPAMRGALLKRAQEVVAASGESMAEPARSACLFLCGHGTSFNDNSTKIVHEQAAAIRELGLFVDCQAVFMEQAPLVQDWQTLTPCTDVVVVPFFIADGLHSFEDIPALLGMPAPPRGGSVQNPLRVGARRLWYATAIGTDGAMADVIIEQVRSAGRNLASVPAHRGRPEIEEKLEKFFGQTAPPWRMGQVTISEELELRHVEERTRPAQSLRQIADLTELRHLALMDDKGAFRPLHAAPNLPRGWLFQARALPELRQALDCLYPAELANWVESQAGRLIPTPWQETTERQTGRFRVVREIDDAGALDLVSSYCEPGCLKQRLWHPAREVVTSDASELPLLCPEACNFLVGKAREKLKGGAED